jgi:hypothetical protein
MKEKGENDCLLLTSNLNEKILNVQVPTIVSYIQSSAA